MFSFYGYDWQFPEMTDLRCMQLQATELQRSASGLSWVADYSSKNTSFELPTWASPTEDNEHKGWDSSCSLCWDGRSGAQHKRWMLTRRLLQAIQGTGICSQDPAGVTYPKGSGCWAQWGGETQGWINRSFFWVVLEAETQTLSRAKRGCLCPVCHVANTDG